MNSVDHLIVSVVNPGEDVETELVDSELTPVTIIQLSIK